MMCSTTKTSQNKGLANRLRGDAMREENVRKLMAFVWGNRERKREIKR